MLLKESARDCRGNRPAASKRAAQRREQYPPGQWLLVQHAVKNPLGLFFHHFVAGFQKLSLLGSKRTQA